MQAGIDPGLLSAGLSKSARSRVPDRPHLRRARLRSARGLP
jgi:hypothetical protein